MARRIAFVVLPVLASLVNVLPGHAQSSATRSEFEVASIKLNASGGRGTYINAAAGGRWSVSNFTLKTVLQVAFDLMDFQVVGGPAWIDSDRYDISAKADGSASFEQMRPMIQSLLADRFKLTVHRETRQLPVYDLGVARSGLRFAASKEGSCAIRDANSPVSIPRPGEKPVCGVVAMRRGAVNGIGVSMSMLATALSGILGCPVNDKIGFSGTFDVRLEFAPDEAIADANVGGRIQGQAPPPTDSAAPSIFTALQEQLGLRLEPASGSFRRTEWIEW